jgi:protein-tyrosine phosphatase/ADP-ribosylglycohydrolase
MDTDSFTAPPLANSYWVVPGRLLAGEYPGSMSRAEAMERVQRLLRSGINSFLDLTEEGELPGYENLLPGLTESRVRYHRLPILDHSIPDSPAHMGRILDVIDGELAAGRNIYVHCHAGIGRTGMAIGCHLIRGGLTGEDALVRLQALWKQCQRSRRWPSIPETSEQIAFVRTWVEPAGDRGATSLESGWRYEGAFVGLAIGDALGMLVATSNFDAGTLATSVRDSSELQTGASTATTRAAGDSLLACSTHDPEDQMRRYLEWQRAVVNTSVPGELRRALSAWQFSRKTNAGSHDPKNLDPHSLPRSLAAAMFMRNQPHEACELAVDISRTTLQSPLVLDLCRMWAALFIDALSGIDKDVLRAFGGPAMKLLRQRALKAPLKDYLDGRATPPSEQPGDAMSVTRAAIEAFVSTSNIHDALLRVATASRVPPQAPALCGALAGAHYGIEAVPLEWRRRLPEDAGLRSLARHLLE